jgi:hypothetical protein
MRSPQLKFAEISMSPAFIKEEFSTAANLVGKSLDLTAKSVHRKIAKL